MFLGTILPWPIPFAPQGWAFCNGQSLPVAQNQALYSLISNIYGGNTVNFNLPNLIGRMPIGSIGMGTAPLNTISAQLATTGGVVQTTLKSTQIAAHGHSISSTATAGGSSTVNVNVNVAIPCNTDAYDATKATNIPGSTVRLGQGKAGSFTTNIYTTSAATPNASLAPFTATGTGTVSVAAPTISSICTGQTPAQTEAVPVVNPYLAINYIIAIEGLYPMRP